MRNGFGCCSRGCVCAAAVAILAVATNVLAAPTPATMTLRPVAVTGPGGCALAGQDVNCTGGGGQVRFEWFIAGWGTGDVADDLDNLNTVQGTIDADGSYNFQRCAGNEDLACVVDGDCPMLDLMPIGMPDGVPDTADTCVGTVYNPCGGRLTPEGYPGPVGNRPQGVFQVTNVCQLGSNPGTDCSSSPAICMGGGFCVGRSDFVHTGFSPVVSCSTSLSLNYTCGSQATANAPEDGGVEKYFATLLINVSSDAVGQYTVRWDRNGQNSFLISFAGPEIPIGTFVDANINVETGSCCSDIGLGTTVCEDMCMTNTICNTRPAPRLFRPNVTCQVPCPSCQSNADCADPIAGLPNNLCTSDVCSNFVCSNTPLYNVGQFCCDPAVGPNGGLTLIDDNDTCTEDLCDPLTGDVAHNGLSGNACDDGFGCTVQDTCANGVCEGQDANTIMCVSDADCPVGECNTTSGLCECSENTPLCVNFIDKHCSISDEFCDSDADCGSSGGVCQRREDITDPNCFENGEAVHAAVRIGAGSELVTGGQFLIDYDPSCLEFVSIGPCAGETLFTEVIQSNVDVVAGTIFYAVHIDPATVTQNGLADEGTPGPYNIACVDFVKVGDCDGCNVCLISQNPQNTLLTNASGNKVPVDNCGCSKDVRLAGDITLTTPGDIMTNADCGKTYADLTWNTASASDSCEGALALDCHAQTANEPSSLDAPSLLALIPNGGRFAQGKTFFVCSAENSCGKAETNVWSVMVTDQHTIDVEVHLQPPMNNAGIFNRAITFDLYSDCASDPTEECAVIQFQGPFNFAGHGTATLKVDKGNYGCITAKDELHTLRAQADVECVNNRWTAIFKGDPQQGGNWLVGGNLDCWKADASYGAMNRIDILDFGMFLAELSNGSSYEPNGDTDCNTGGPHGDINADGLVDDLDYAFIFNNFLAASKGLCCNACVGGANDGQNCISQAFCNVPDSEGVTGVCWTANGPLAAEDILPAITEISVKDLRRMGYTELAGADLNKDGVLNMDDMALYMQGSQPEQNVGKSRKQRGTR